MKRFQIKLYQKNASLQKTIISRLLELGYRIENGANTDTFQEVLKNVELGIWGPLNNWKFMCFSGNYLSAMASLSSSLESEMISLDDLFSENFPKYKKSIEPIPVHLYGECTATVSESGVKLYEKEFSFKEIELIFHAVEKMKKLIDER